MAFPRSKASTTARGYGAEHQQLRAQLLPSAYGKPCTRCGKPLLPGQALHFDHNDARTGYLGFAHAWCNKRAGARKGSRIAHRKAKAKASITTYTRW